MEAPLEKIATDDCSDQVFSLWHDLRDNIGLAGDDQILTALRVVATAFDLKPPVGAALKIYMRALAEIPGVVLLQVTERIVREYHYPTFPRPADWLERAKPSMTAIDKAKLMMQLYPGRLRLARRKYAPKG